MVSMIRNSYARHMQANEQRMRLIEIWGAYPGPVQFFLQALLRDHGLQAAQIASRAVEVYVHVSEKKEEGERKR